MCRYALAASMVIYMRVIDLADGQPPTLGQEDWERLLSSEEAFLGPEQLRQIAANGRRRNIDHVLPRPRARPAV